MDDRPVEKIADSELPTTTIYDGKQLVIPREADGDDDDLDNVVRAEWTVEYRPVCGFTVDDAWLKEVTMLDHIGIPEDRAQEVYEALKELLFPGWDIDDSPPLMVQFDYGESWSGPNSEQYPHTVTVGRFYR